MERSFTFFPHLRSFFRRPAVSGLMACALVAASATLLQSCGKKKSSSSEFSSECVVPDDQTGTFIGKWQIAPVPIAFHVDDFSASELNAITAAATTWNRFFAASMGFQSLDFLDGEGKLRTVAENKPLYNCSTVIFDPQTQEYNGVIVIYKQKFWGYADKATTIARTSTCPDGNHHFYSGFIEVNFETFFSAGKQAPDLESIMLHEFGHLLGLKHSCEETPGDGMPNCSSKSLPSSYKTASLYPAFGYNEKGEGEKRRKVNTNDQGRMNCLYKDP